MPNEHPDPDDVSLEMCWDDILVARRRAGAPQREEPSFRWKVEPGDLAIGTSKDRILVVIKPDGTLQYGPEYRPDEAAMIFWESMGQRRLQMEDRVLLIQHMEAVLTRLGDADLQADSARRIALNSPENEDLQRRAQQASARVSQAAHQAIELGRALIRRPGIPMPAFPEEVPQSVQEVDHSAYEGREAFEDEGEGEEGPNVMGGPINDGDDS